jgi:hypothetical protein
MKGYMEIVEQYREAKNGGTDSCEDDIIVTNAFACVIDGVSSKSNRLWEGKTSGLKAASIIKSAVQLLPEQADLGEAIEFLTESVSSYYRKHGVEQELKNNPIYRLAATIALYSRYHNEVWMVGDCQCMVDETLYTNPLLIDEVMANVRAAYLHIELKKGKTVDDLLKNDTGRDYIKPLMSNQWVFQNSFDDSPYSYSVIDGFAVPKDRVKIVKVPDYSKYIVLASDGYPSLRSTLNKSEEVLSKILSEDKLCISIYKALTGLTDGKISYDDRAYIRLAL